MSTIFKYGDDVNTDVILPARYMNDPRPEALAKHCMEDIDSDFVQNVKSGDIILAGANFGCGSSRKHAPIAIKACGVHCVIASSFARIFYRNAINIGLPIMECREAAEKIQEGDQISVDFKQGLIKNESRNEVYTAKPFPPFIEDIIEEGGLLASIKAKE